MSNLFTKYFIKENKEDVFHSSLYGKAQNGGTMGAFSKASFSERRKIDENRQVIKGYSDSQVAMNRFNGGERPKQYVPPASKNKFGK